MVIVLASDDKLKVPKRSFLQAKNLEDPAEASEIIKFHPLSLLLYPLSDPETTSVKLTPQSLGDWEWKKKRAKCMVCWGTIKADDKKVVSCASCGRKAHKPHIQSWLRSKKVCPSCRAPWQYGSDN